MLTSASSGRKLPPRPADKLAGGQINGQYIPPPPAISAPPTRPPAFNGAFSEPNSASWASSRPKSSDSDDMRDTSVQMPVPHLTGSYSMQRLPTRPPGALPPKTPGYNGHYEEERMLTAQSPMDELYSSPSDYTVPSRGYSPLPGPVAARSSQNCEWCGPERGVIILIILIS